MIKRLWVVAIIVLSGAAMGMAAWSLGATWSSRSAAPIDYSRNLTLPAPSKLELTYIANEGVLISSGGKQILIDGLHRKYKPDYAYLPDEQREKIETAKPPFDQIDLILVSHQHLDHFHPESVGRYLEHNQKAVLVSSQQVMDQVANRFAGYQAIKSRITAATPPLKTRLAMKAAGIEFDLLGLSHGAGRHATIQNLGHLIKIGGWKLLHVGDAEINVDNFSPLNLAGEGIDIAFLPFWYLTSSEGQALVRQQIKPKRIVAIHVSPEQTEEVTAQVKRAFPDAVVFGAMLEKKSY